MDSSVFGELALILAIGAGISLVMRLIRQPLLIGYVLTGIVAGPSLFNLHSSADTLEVLADFGIALLLFIVGLGLNPKVVKELGKVSSVTAVVQVCMSIIAGGILLVLLGENMRTAIIVSVAIAFSSTIVGLKILNDKREQSRLYGRIAIGVLLVQDILATLALLILSAHEDGSGLGAFGALALKALALGIPLFFIANKILPRFNHFIASSQEFLFLFAIAWGFGVGTLFELIGFSVEIGALIAGVSLASMSYAQEVAARLRPVRDLFIIIFFISLGAGLSIESVLTVAPTALILSAFVLICNPLAIIVPMLLFKHTLRNSYKVGVVMAQISEFSLIFAVLARDQGLITDSILTMLTLVALITIAISCYMMIYDDEVLNFFEKHFKFWQKRRAGNYEQRHHYDMILFGYQKGGHEFVKTFEKLEKRFVVIDYDPVVIDTLEQRKLPYIYGDAGDPELLEELSLEHTRLIVSTLSDSQVNLFLLEYLDKRNPNAVFICVADDMEHAAELYEAGASYVMLPHYIGSEKISAFIRKNGFSKAEFRKFREKHLQYLQTHLVDEPASAV